MPVAKKSKKRALGRGLDSLLPAGDTLSKNFFECDIDIISPNHYQPRLHFPEESIEELANSIRKQGIIQPLTVRKIENGYELAAGERRLRAAHRAGLKKVPVIVRDFSNSEMLEISIVENIQRENLNPMEEADAYHRLMEEFNLTQEEAASKVGRSRPAVANTLRLRHLSDQIKQDIKTGILSAGHARAILSIDSKIKQNEIARFIIAKKLSVRQAEDLIKRIKNKKDDDNRGGKNAEQIYFTDLSQSLSNKFGTKVKIVKKGKKGRVEIDFYGDEDLDRIINFLQ
ncbi:MAG: ParB/RepB/Spo0J family partition protein [Deltaproteobacteria bacterium]|nr:ParB/RepB/Spo0J family partition protein [Deltaproteobacteria bacterium]